MGFQKGHQINKGRSAWNKGIPWSKKVKDNISKAKKGKKQKKKRIITERLKKLWIKNLYKNGKSPWLGRKLTDEHKRKCGEWQQGANSPKWKGGKHKSQFGYVHIYNPNHPFANGNYVFEHRLVMEKLLGRYLKPTEIIHHLNGIRDDNRPENLILTVSNKNWHPCLCPKCGFEFAIE